MLVTCFLKPLSALYRALARHTHQLFDGRCSIVVRRAVGLMRRDGRTSGVSANRSRSAAFDEFRVFRFDGGARREMICLNRVLTDSVQFTNLRDC